jgi:hypothetical protein
MAMQTFRMSHFSTYMATYGANIAGHLYNGGGVVLLLGGAILSSPLDIIAALLNFGSSFTLSFFGRRNWGVACAALLAIVINILAAWPGFANRETTSFLGVGIVFITQTLAAFSGPLERHYAGASSVLLRETLGQPRRTSGLTQLVLCRWPLIYGNLMHDRLLGAIVFIIWAAADLAFAMSKPTAKPCHP